MARARCLIRVGLKGCEEECLRNCTCNAYASADISKEESDGGCVTWHGELVDTREFPSGGQDLYIRVDAVEVGMQSMFLLIIFF